MAEKQSYLARELAVRWRMHVTTIIRAIERGQIAGFKVSRSWRVSAAEVKRLEAGKPRPAADGEQQTSLDL